MSGAASKIFSKMSAKPTPLAVWCRSAPAQFAIGLMFFLGAMLFGIDASDGYLQCIAAPLRWLGADESVIEACARLHPITVKDLEEGTVILKGHINDYFERVDGIYQSDFRASGNKP